MWFHATTQEAIPPLPAACALVLLPRAARSLHTSAVASVTRSKTAATGVRAGARRVMADDRAVAAAFVNVGLQHWLEQRQKWLTRPKGDGSAGRVGRPKAIDVSVDVVEGIINDVDGVRELPRAIPLPQMVDMLVELWEEEGLFD